ncbi:tetratricopeptide repeat protein [Saccharopolyspora sp. SCSIO 74807]|uniref:tetratricopeptide repeat protein n=1 Tax=Saccharopolyspora sp. SCSIO 74807 TaxID=3118084 RepID=UPI0030CB2111
MHNSASDGQNVVQAQHIHGDVHIHGSAAREGASAAPPRQLPATARHFINRTVEQDALTTLLNGSGAQHTLLVSTISGLAGVGKSTLVVEWAHKVRDQFPDGELYVNLRGFDPAAEPVIAAEALAGFLTALGMEPDAIPASEQARAAQYRTLAHGRRMLLVLDNARDAEQVLPLLPGAAGCLVVVTSRQRLDGLVTHHGAQRLALDTLTPEEGHQLLARHLGGERLDAEPDAAATLLEFCAGLPLALTLVSVQAAAEPDVPLGDLVADLANEHDRLDALDAGGITGIRAVFSWSYRTLSPPAARLFRLLGLPISPDVSLAAAAALAGVDHRSARKLLGELGRAHLVTRRAGDRYVFHDLLRAYARERAHADDTESDRTATLQRLLDHHLYATYAANRQLAPARDLVELEYVDEQLNCSFADYDEALAWWDAEHAGVLATIRQTTALGMPRAGWLANAATYPMRLRGLISELKTSSTAGIEAARQNDDRPALARLHADLSEACWRLRELDRASENARIAAGLFEALGERMWTAITSCGSALMCLDAQQYADAVTSARHAKRILDELGGTGEAVPESLATQQLTTDSLLGVALAHCGEFDEAFPLLRRALELDWDEFGRGYVLHRLATAHLLAGNIADAVETCGRAVEHRRRIGHSAGEAESLTELGKAQRANGDTEAARHTWQQALAILDPLGHHNAEVIRGHLNALAGQ